MVNTRSTTGTIERVHYDYPTLQLQSEARQAQENPPQTPRSRRTRALQKAAADRAQVEILLEELNADDAAARKARKEKTTSEIPDPSNGHNFILPVAFGEPQKEGMSRVQLVAEEIRKWEIVKESHQKHYPRAVSSIDLTLNDLKKKLDDLLADDRNFQIGDESKKQQEIALRVGDLTKAKENSEFEPERENIQAAINGYNSGAIPYSSLYTLIYAGRIVDTVETYADFVVDRLERLDRYQAEWGDHWLWWERGLDTRPEAAPKAHLCCSLQRELSSNNLGSYYLSQTYWKRSGWVMRMPTMLADGPKPMNYDDGLKFKLTPTGMAYCQEEGPKVNFFSLLDSGASFPSLYENDFITLSIEKKFYSAQSLERMTTANGPICSRVYELFVTINGNDFESLVDTSNPVWPNAPPWLGGLCPVSEIVDSVGSPDIPDANGHLVNLRLSGLLPFLACYMSTVPSTGLLYLGEDRNDVVGCAKLPPHRRWDISSPYKGQTDLAELRLGDPKILFSHRGGKVIDQDRTDVPHNSTVTFFPNTLKQQVRRSHPDKPLPGEI